VQSLQFALESLLRTPTTADNVGPFGKATVCPTSLGGLIAHGYAGAASGDGGASGGDVLVGAYLDLPPLYTPMTDEERVDFAARSAETVSTTLQMLVQDQWGPPIAAWLRATLLRSQQRSQLRGGSVANEALVAHSRWNFEVGAFLSGLDPSEWLIYASRQSAIGTGLPTTAIFVELPLFGGTAGPDSPHAPHGATSPDPVAILRRLTQPAGHIRGTPSLGERFHSALRKCMQFLAAARTERDGIVAPEGGSAASLSNARYLPLAHCASVAEHLLAADGAANALPLLFAVYGTTSVTLELVEHSAPKAHSYSNVDVRAAEFWIATAAPALCLGATPQEASVRAAWADAGVELTQFMAIDAPVPSLRPRSSLHAARKNAIDRLLRTTAGPAVTFVPTPSHSQVPPRRPSITDFNPFDALPQVEEACVAWAEGLAGWADVLADFASIFGLPHCDDPAVASPLFAQTAAFSFDSRTLADDQSDEPVLVNVLVHRRKDAAGTVTPKVEFALVGGPGRFAWHDNQNVTQMEQHVQPLVKFFRTIFSDEARGSRRMSGDIHAPQNHVAPASSVAARVATYLLDRLEGLRHTARSYQNQNF
jgi:hypothetical protein